MTSKAITDTMKRMEDKLRELMGEEEFHKFSVELAKEAFRKEIDGMEDSEFKRFVTANFGAITADDCDINELAEKYRNGTGESE